MERKFNFVPGEYYHIYNRGVEKRPIFQEEGDWKRFQHLLYLCNSKKPLIYKLIQGDPLETLRGQEISSVLAYALMPNHFHLIVKETEEGGVSKFIGKLSTAYSAYFNKKYERSGALFCRPFRAKHIDGDDYLRWVFSYIHLNPIAQNANSEVSQSATKLKGYQYCSYSDYFSGSRKEGVIINKAALPIDVSNLENVEQMLGLIQGVPLELEKI